MWPNPHFVTQRGGGGGNATETWEVSTSGNFEGLRIETYKFPSSGRIRIHQRHDRRCATWQLIIKVCWSLNEFLFLWLRQSCQCGYCGRLRLGEATTSHTQGLSFGTYHNLILELSESYQINYSFRYVRKVTVKQPSLKMNSSSSKSCFILISYHKSYKKVTKRIRQAVKPYASPLKKDINFLSSVIWMAFQEKGKFLYLPILAWWKICWFVSPFQFVLMECSKGQASLQPQRLPRERPARRCSQRLFPETGRQDHFMQMWCSVSNWPTRLAFVGKARSINEDPRDETNMGNKCM